MAIITTLGAESTAHGGGAIAAGSEKRYWSVKIRIAYKNFIDMCLESLLLKVVI
jgi:hypothetical protein